MLRGEARRVGDDRRARSSSTGGRRRGRSRPPPSRSRRRSRSSSTSRDRRPSRARRPPGAPRRRRSGSQSATARRRRRAASAASAAARRRRRVEPPGRERARRARAPTASTRSATEDLPRAPATAAVGGRAAAPARGADRRASPPSSEVVGGRPAAVLGESSLERGDERVHRREPVLRPLGHRPLHELVDAWVTRRAGARARSAPGRSGAARHGDDALRRVRHLAGQELVERGRRASTGPSARRPAARRLLGREVVARPEDRPASRSAPSSGPDRAGDPEVGHLGHAVGVDEDVLRLHVPVHDPVLVREREPARGLVRDARARVGRGAGRGRRRTSFRFCPSTCSKTMNCGPSTSPRSITVTMFGCESRAIARASRRKRSTYSVVVRVALVQDLQRDVAARARGRARGRRSTCRRRPRTLLERRSGPRRRRRRSRAKSCPGARAS